MRRFASAVALLAASTIAVSAQRKPAVDVPLAVARIGEYVQAYFARAQSIICDEIVREQELGFDLLSAAAPARTVVNELRISWDAAPDGGVATPLLLRNLLTVNGRPPREKDQNKCFDPDASTPDILGELFLPENQAKFRFAARPMGKVSGRAAVVLDVFDLDKGPVEVQATDDCVKFGKPGSMKWRIWADAETYAVLRIDQTLNTMFDATIPANRKNRTPERTITVERSDTTINYRQVHFTDPEETILLPESRQMLQSLRSSGSPRMRITYNYRNYRRFMTGGRIVE